MANADWQPIETAPKDGTEILGWSRFMSKPAPVTFNRGWQASWDGSSVIEYQGDFGTEYKSAEPLTHWQPLPTPPKDTVAV